ncbi:MAG: protease-like activity factor CPAF, partial [Chlamydiia bacterium]|nr:protease-like activity factor CPAF [Chlamydiia bacterium]
QGEMNDFVSSLRSQFETRYAPVQWKKELRDWSLDEEIALLQEKIDGGSLSVKQFQQEVARFFHRLDDYHCSVLFFSTEASSLPFLVKKVEGEYHITYIDESKLDTKTFDIAVGDRLISFDGRAVDETVKELIRVPDGASPLTEQSLAELTLTNRRGSKAHICPKGPIRITVEKQESGKRNSYELVWSYSPELIQNPLVKMGPKGYVSPFDVASKNPQLKCNIDMKVAGFHPHSLGEKQTYLPPLGSIVWESPYEGNFHAYIFLTPEGKKIGYLRIPHYMFDEKHIEELAPILARFEQETESLVIDQLNNTGGNIFFLYGLLSMLTDEPLKTPLHHMRLTQGDVMLAYAMLDALKAVSNNDEAQMIWGPTFYGYPVNYQTVVLLRNYYQHMIDQWMAGKLFADPIHVYAIDTINPNPKVRYTKPLLVLINELCFSGGDFFPGILQDNGRATLMGVKTAGAGGYVTAQMPDNLVGINLYSLTASLAIRQDGTPIENLGVSPEIYYELTKEDILKGFKPFAEAILKAVSEL